MNKIKSKEINKEIKKLTKITSKHKIITRKIKEQLTQQGYKEICLGTGKQSISYSKMITTWNLKNSFAQGNYFGVGIRNISYGKGKKYYALVKEVV